MMYEDQFAYSKSTTSTWEDLWEEEYLGGGNHLLAPSFQETGGELSPDFFKPEGYDDTLEKFLAQQAIQKEVAKLEVRAHTMAYHNGASSANSSPPNSMRATPDLPSSSAASRNPSPYSSIDFTPLNDGCLDDLLSNPATFASPSTTAAPEDLVVVVDVQPLTNQKKRKATKAPTKPPTKPIKRRNITKPTPVNSKAKPAVVAEFAVPAPAAAAAPTVSTPIPTPSVVVHSNPASAASFFPSAQQQAVDQKSVVHCQRERSRRGLLSVNLAKLRDECGANSTDSQTAILKKACDHLAEQFKVEAEQLAELEELRRQQEELIRNNEALRQTLSKLQSGVSSA